MRRTILLLSGLITLSAADAMPTHGSYQLILSGSETASTGPNQMNVIVALRNVCPRKILLTFTSSPTEDYEIRITNRTGQLVPMSEMGKLLTYQRGPIEQPDGSMLIPPGHEARTTDLLPNEKRDEVIDIRELYDLQPGRYTLILRRALPVFKGDQRPFSNPFTIVVPSP